MKVQFTIALAVLAAAAMAQDHDHYRDHPGHYARDRVAVEHPIRWDHDHHRYWDGVRWVASAEYVPVEPAVVVGGDALLALNVRIGNLDLQIANLRNGHYYAGRDARIRELCVERDRCAGRAAWLRR